MALRTGLEEEEPERADHSHTAIAAVEAIMNSTVISHVQHLAKRSKLQITELIILRQGDGRIVSISKGFLPLMPSRHLKGRSESGHNWLNVPNQ